MERESNTFPLWNPYLAGLLLGGTLFASFLILGAGLGASSSLARTSAYLKGCCFAIGEEEYFARWGKEPLSYYLVFMFVGTFMGGLLSAHLGKRIEPQLERGAKCAPKLRATYALLGGLLVGYASRMASGCTSGQALTGGALLVTGGLLFMIFCFAGGYIFAYFVRGQWHD